MVWGIHWERGVGAVAGERTWGAARGGPAVDYEQSSRGSRLAGRIVGIKCSYWGPKWFALRLFLPFILAEKAILFLVRYLNSRQEINGRPPGLGVLRGLILLLLLFVSGIYWMMVYLWECPI
jgi:hypothetical protein